MEHYKNYLKSINDPSGEKGFRCEACQIDVFRRLDVNNHFQSSKHRSTLLNLRRDLKSAGFAVPQEEEGPPEPRLSKTPSRAASTEDQAVEDAQPPESQSRIETSTPKNERVPSRSDEHRSDEDKNSKKHQYFLSSEEEQSDDENLNAESQQATPSKSRAEANCKPKVLVISAKSLVDKRKAIISKLSNCTDVRDLTKHLRQISGSRSEEKSARKALPGVPYSDREIEQQETFGEARAQRTQTDKLELGADDDSSDCPPVVKKESRSAASKAPRTPQRRDDVAEECTVVPTPAQPPPETISDTDTDDQESPQRRPTSSVNSFESLKSQVHPNEFGKLAAVVAQEVALVEKLRYLGQTLPCIEALLAQMRQEHQDAQTQIGLLRTAKNRLIAAITQGPPAPQSLDVFNPNSILNTILQPSISTGLGSMPWSTTSSNANFSTFLHSLGLPESAMSPRISSAFGVPNGNSSLNSSLAETVASTSVQAPCTPCGTNDKKRTASRDSRCNESKRSKNAEFDEQLHSEIVLVVKLSESYVYTSSKDGIVKRTPLQDGAGAVVSYKHCASDSNSKLPTVCAYMLEVVVHKKLKSVKVITGSNDCAIRVFDAVSGNLMKVVPVQARVQCGLVHWQKIYVGLKSGYIQVYNIVDQRYIVESQHKQVPKLMAVNEILNSKSIVIVTEENSVLIRDAGTLFVLHAIDRLDQEVKALMVKDDHILLCGKDKLYVFDKNAKLSLTVDLSSSVYCAVPMKSGALFATTEGCLRSCKWKGFFVGNEIVQNTIAFSRDIRAIVTSMDGSDAKSTVALATDCGRVIVLRLTSRSC
ncbi:uncharacterized protein LOC100906508 [Galendromus occidentalis]|uniref:Uncharacterized protein LOC100906508 n=1 Tax=Galendromus occidentalis TaxID=34638 RepID=A0AAJ6QUM7_9ACAR|nr:uncharacterized protein LOC100906508 [Galendromus occidentalis]